MGIEYIILNLDKKESLDFDRLDFGTKRTNMISEPIASCMVWLLINPEGHGPDVPKMLGRWAGDKIEIVGDGEDEGWERQERARKEFKDITVETVEAFAAGNPFQRITELQPMGLIDKDGKVVADSHGRDAVNQYWKEKEEQEERELDQYLAEQGIAPKGSPATPPGNSGTTDGPPSAS